MKKAVWMILLGLALSPLANADNLPMVLSYAQQPIRHFNHELLTAQQELRQWTQLPDTISQRYAGQSFTVTQVVHQGDGVVTYSQSQAYANHPQLLLVVSMNKHNGQWQINGAKLSWRCEKGQYFSTDPCESLPQANPQQ
ncbi:hypothetical protein NFHSH190041_10510 [Shewanella sp. NFH-SH190041]|uniref:hypothetical protein n=1 Tax=Shewanella sp. NFH-SH190041 TaxID=2950245 RepID=UPI0021C3FD81|nr:hypothetical protein [Shewanella sp. NFH-SH190041]BDM63599.1 hypothetical protein NFHSH190041_10510 [Shewanella sp. NFH-SH190041]